MPRKQSLVPIAVKLAVISCNVEGVLPETWFSRDRERSMLRASIFSLLFGSRRRRGSSTIPGSESIPTTRRSV
jgi:hypothetical protein